MPDKTADCRCDVHRCDTLHDCLSQGQIKDVQRELEDARTAQKETLSIARETERRAKAMETDFMQLQEVLMHCLCLRV